MLPGLRFLFAAILLSASVLVFGLGATSLLRATHEEYVSYPSWRNGPKEQVFAQAPEPVRPVLAALRAEPEEEAAPTLRDQVPTIGLPLSEPQQIASLQTETREQPAVEVAEAAPAAETPATEVANVETPATELSKTETPVTEPARAEAAAPATTDTLTAADTTASIPEAKSAAPESNETRRAETAATLAASALDIVNAKVAALNDPATTALRDPPAKAKADSTISDGKATKRRAKAKKRHRVVRRLPPPVQQQQLDPFGQPLYAATTTRTR
jgi:hypothetical protein